MTEGTDSVTSFFEPAPDTLSAPPWTKMNPFLLKLLLSMCFNSAIENQKQNSLIPVAKYLRPTMALSPTSDIPVFPSPATT